MKEIKTRGFSDLTKDMLVAYGNAAFNRFIENIKALPESKQKEGHHEFLEEMQSAIALGQITFVPEYIGTKKKYEILVYAFGRPVAPFEVSAYKLKKFYKNWLDHNAH